jgi:hypothetical protein
MRLAFDAMLVMGPEHSRIYREAGWDRERVAEHLNELTRRSGSEITRGAGGIAEGLPLPDNALEVSFPKFKSGHLLIVHAGGGAGLFSAIIGGWVNGAEGSQPVAREIVR